MPESGGRVSEALRAVRDPEWWASMTPQRMEAAHNLALGDGGTLGQRHKLLKALDRGAEKRFGVSAGDYSSRVTPELRAQWDAAHAAERTEGREQLTEALRAVRDPEWWASMTPQRMEAAHNLALGDGGTLGQRHKLLKALDRGAEKRFGVSALSYASGPVTRVDRTAREASRKVISSRITEAVAASRTATKRGHEVQDTMPRQSVNRGR